MTSGRILASEHHLKLRKMLTSYFNIKYIKDLYMKYITLFVTLVIEGRAGHLAFLFLVSVLYTDTEL